MESMHPKMTHHNMKHVQKQGKSAGRGRCIPKRDKFEARQGQHMHKRDNTEPEGVSAFKKGMIWGQKGSMHPKEGHMMARRGRHVQKQGKKGRKGLVRPKKGQI